MLSELRCPVLASRGALDVSVMVQSARTSRVGRRQREGRGLADVAHMIGMEAPDRLNALIVEFLEPLRPWE